MSVAIRAAVGLVSSRDNSEMINMPDSGRTRLRPIRGVARAHIDALETALRRYGPGHSQRKIELLDWLAHAHIKSKAQVERFHRQLMFIRAFPDDAPMLAAVERPLALFEKRIRALGRKDRIALEDTGIVGTVSRHHFDVRIVEWLVKRFPGRVDINWRGLRDPAGLEFLLRLALATAETDGFDSSMLTTRAWLRHARGASSETDLECLLRLLRQTRIKAAHWSTVWDQAEIPVAWQVIDAAGSTTTVTLPATPIVYRPLGPRRAPKRPRELILAPLAGIRLLGPRRAKAIIDLARAALTARCREVYAITHGNTDEVHLADLGEGACVAIIGVRPEMRLSLESNYGFLLLVNGVPVGYGGITPLFRQANTGINVFDAFRGSEAAMLWAQTLRALRTLFGVNRFIVNPYQFGAGNSEAIASAAFWFYYRLGFRPISRSSRSFAAREFALIRRNRRHRTNAKTLAALADGNLELVLPGAQASDRFEEIWLERLGLCVTERLAQLAVRGIREAELWKRVRRSLGIRGRFAGWREPGPRQLAPFIALIDDLESWPRRARASITALLTAKGASQELEFVQAARRADHLFANLARCARRRHTGGLQHR